MIAVGGTGAGVDEALHASVLGGDEHVEEAVDVGAVGGDGVGDRAGDGAEGGLVEDDVDAFAGGAAGVEVGNVGFEEAEAGPGVGADLGADVGEVLAAAVGEVVEAGDGVAVPEEGLGEGGADEAGGAGDEPGAGGDW